MHDHHQRRAEVLVLRLGGSESEPAATVTVLANAPSAEAIASAGLSGPKAIIAGAAGRSRGQYLAPPDAHERHPRLLLGVSDLLASAAAAVARR